MENCENQTLQDFVNRLLAAEGDATKLPALMGLIEEAFDCKQEINELKADIERLKAKGTKFTIIARRERLLTQKRANYTNMITRICKEIRKTDDKSNPYDNLEALEDYE